MRSQIYKRGFYIFGNYFFFTSLIDWWSSWDPELLWMFSHAHPCSRHEHWHTGDVLVHLVGLLVYGFSVWLTIWRRRFSWQRKVPVPVLFYVYIFIYRQIDQETTSLLRMVFNHVLYLGCVCSWFGSLCERALWGFFFFYHRGGFDHSCWFLLTSDFCNFAGGHHWRTAVWNHLLCYCSGVHHQRGRSS